jgi:DNA-binding NtrC family response regulator
MQEKDKKGAILIIDDEEVMRKFSKDTLEPLGYEVLIAADGSEGVRLFSENMERIALVVLDMIMPSKGGKETFWKIKELRPQAKILICSGYGDAAYYDELFQGREDGFLAKPFTHPDFLAKFDEAMKRK